MLRATPGWRRMWPRRSSVRTIWCTEGGLSWKWRCMSVSAGGRPWTRVFGEVREPIPAAPGQLERVDYEYRRNGTVNLFVAVDAHRPWRKVTVTEQRTARDYGKRLRELVDVDYPGAG